MQSMKPTTYKEAIMQNIKPITRKPNTSGRLTSNQFRPLTEQAVLNWIQGQNDEKVLALFQNIKWNSEWNTSFNNQRPLRHRAGTRILPVHVLNFLNCCKNPLQRRTIIRALQKKRRQLEGLPPYRERVRKSFEGSHGVRQSVVTHWLVGKTYTQPNSEFQPPKRSQRKVRFQLPERA